MSDLLDKIEGEFTDEYQKIMGSWGISPAVTKAYATLFLAKKPIGLKEISERTGYSISTVCNVMEILERVVDVRRFKKPGSKKVFWECQHDLLLVQQKKFIEADRQIQSIMGLFKDAGQKLEGEKSRESETVRGYMVKASEDLERFHEILHELVTMIREEESKRDG